MKNIEEKVVVLLGIEGFHVVIIAQLLYLLEIIVSPLFYLLQLLQIMETVSLHILRSWLYICWSWVIMQHYSLKLEMLLQNVTLWPIIHILEFWEKSEIQCVYFVLNRGKTAIKVGQFPKFRLLIIKFQVSKNAVFQKCKPISVGHGLMCWNHCCYGCSIIL